MPYIYSSVHQCYTDMLPLNRGLYIEYPADQQSYQHPGEFLFGDLLLGAPVTAPGEGEQKIVRQEVWLPGDEEWYHFFNGQSYKGGQTVTVESDLNEFPLFIKGGYPLPMQPYTERMCSTPLTQLIVRCYPGREGADHSYTLYEDDGLTTGYEQGLCATTLLNYRKTDGRTLITIHPAEGSYDGQPQQRAYRIELPGVPAGSPVTVNGKRVKTTFDAALNALIVPVKTMSIRKAVNIQTNG